MKTIFDNSERDQLINRIKSVNKNNTAQWGKMNLSQMLMHCTNWDEWILGKNQPVYKQAFIGFIFGKMALKNMIKDDSPIRKNVPTSSQFKIKETEVDLESEKRKWVSLIESYEHYSNPDFIHDFFGKMTKEQIGILAYKHSDHHLRQFGA
jgi:hypothetical protein